jgi:hypothetical protein
MQRLERLGRLAKETDAAAKIEYALLKKKQVMPFCARN